MLYLDNKSKILRILSGGEVKLNYSVESYSINNLKPNKHHDNPEEITLILNQYLRTQPDDAFVINVLSQAFQYYDTMLNTRDLVQNTKAYIERFINAPMFDPDVVRKWVVSDVTVPSSFNKEYKDDPNHTREQTYLASDYIDVVVLAIYMKALMPLTASYLNNITAEYGKSTCELEFLKVVPKRITELPGYKMLYKYTDMFADSKTINHELLLKREISSEDRTDWLFSVLLIKRIVSGTVYNNADVQTLVSYLYRQIKNKSDNTNASFNFKDKCVGAGDATETTETSVLEKFRYKDKITVAENMMLQEAIGDGYILQAMGDLINVPEYKANSEAYIKSAPSPTELQLNLCKMVLMPYISHHALWLVTQEELLRKLMLAHMLIREKHPLISLLIIAHREEDDVVDLYLRKNKLTTAMLEKLDAMYPYCKVKGAVQNTGRQYPTLIRTTLEDMCKDTCGWRVSLPQNSSQTLRDYTDGGSIITPSNIREVFCLFFLDLDTLTETNT